MPIHSWWEAFLHNSHLRHQDKVVGFPRHVLRTGYCNPIGRFGLLATAMSTDIIPRTHSESSIVLTGGCTVWPSLAHDDILPYESSVAMVIGISPRCRFIRHAGRLDGSWDFFS